MRPEGYTLCLTERSHTQLRAHLFPGDGKEAAAILLCKHALPARKKIMVVEILLVPYDQCSIRTSIRLSWPGEILSEAIDRAEIEGLTIILLHSHPGGLLGFSKIDDDSDTKTIPNIFTGWSGPIAIAGHGSAVMTPDGLISARLYDESQNVEPIQQITVIGDEIRHWWTEADQPITRSGPMAFGAEMTDALKRLHACVIGVSGTGSIIAEQAARMGFGKLTLIDFDRIEKKNLNRILNSTVKDAELASLKTDMFLTAARSYRPDLEFVTVNASIATREAVLAAAAADVVFSCVDTAEGRQIADLLAQAFMIPLFDMGVSIPTRRTPEGTLAVAEVIGRIDYVQPGGSTLGDRSVYTPSSLRAEYLAQNAPEAFAAERDAGYIKGAPEEAPSVIALNMRAASAAMLEFIARAYPFRHGKNRDRARTIFALADGDEDLFSEDDFASSGTSGLGIGAREPLLGLPALGA